MFQNRLKFSRPYGRGIRASKRSRLPLFTAVQPGESSVRSTEVVLASQRGAEPGSHVAPEELSRRAKEPGTASPALTPPIPSGPAIGWSVFFKSLP